MAFGYVIFLVTPDYLIHLPLKATNSCYLLFFECLLCAGTILMTLGKIASSIMTNVYTAGIISILQVKKFSLYPNDLIIWPTSWSDGTGWTLICQIWTAAPHLYNALCFRETNNLQRKAIRNWRSDQKKHREMCTFEPGTPWKL